MFCEGNMDINYDEIENKLKNNKEIITYYVETINIKYKHFDNNMGIYSFWYDNRDKKLNGLNRNLIIEGPSKIKQHIEWDWNLDDEYVCLYVGKTTTLKERIGQHLLLKTDNLKNINGNQLNKKTTSCQLRSGFDYLYSKDSNIYIKNELMQRLYLSLYYENDFIKRFYIEDYLIGKLRPWFNIDSER
jgi:hypothetical protein